MKACAYCGRENPDAAETCNECGTKLEDLPARPVEPVVEVAPASEWFDSTLKIVGKILIAVLFYLLSLGPVSRFAGTTTVTSSGTLSSGPFTTVVTTRYPVWVSILYYPAFALRFAGGSNLYARYIAWWEGHP